MTTTLEWNALLDENYQPVLFAIDSTDPTKLVPLRALETGELKIEIVS